MPHLFVYELLSGGGLGADADTPAARELMPMGIAMRDAIVGDLLALPGLQLSVACSPAAPIAPGLAPDQAARVRAVEARPGEGPVEAVARLAEGHAAVWVVAPESEGLLAALARAIDPGRWIGSRAEAIELASHKSRTLAAAAALGLATPLSLTPREPARWVVKPERGAGAVDTWVLPSRAQAEAHARARREGGESVALQPWVDGEPMSLTLLCGPHEVEVLSINRQQVPVDAAGQLRFEAVAPVDWAAEDPRRELLAAWARRAVQAVPGLRGLLGVDLVWHPVHGPVLIEVNPRVTCACVGLSRRLGRPLAWEALRACGLSLEAAHAR